MAITDSHTKIAFEAFNARFIRPREVARTFVPPKAFFELLENNHSVLGGPRGSGKTTLLKMLTLEALAEWGDERRDEVLNGLPFLGIFVGADVLWATQASTLLHGLESDTASEDIRHLLFRIQVCLSCLDTLDFALRISPDSDSSLAQHAIVMERSQEQALAEALSASWALSPSIPSLWGIRVALRAEVAQAEMYARALRSGKPAHNIAPQSLGVSWLSSVQAFVEAVNYLTSSNRRWALLVDELEITFPRLRDELFASLRSTYQSILIKLALFPVQDASPDLFSEAAPTSVNDYRPIQLWYSNKEASYPFCSQLYRMLAERHLGTADSDPERVLGDSVFDSGRSSRRDKKPAYGPDGDIHTMFSQLEQKDPGFREYISRRGIDLARMDRMTEDEQASKVRKVLPLVAVRNQFLRVLPDTVESSPHMRGLQHARRLKSGPSVNIYSGAHSLFALSEGNPRILINLIGPLLTVYAEGGRKGPISRKIQAIHIRAVLDRYRASISGTPYSSVRDGRNVLDLVNTIGRQFERSTLGDEFIADYPMSFTIDDRVDYNIKDLIGRAVNLGAIVPARRWQGDAVIRDVEEGEFRLSYLFAPLYRLPISQSGRDVPLHSLLETKEPWSISHRKVMFRREAGIYQLGFTFDD